MARRWRPAGRRRLERCRVFDVDEVRFVPPDREAAETFYRIDAPEWINVIALTDDEQVLFVRQFRFGTEQTTLEIPGGMCDPGEAPVDAARRELREETGFITADLTQLGAVHPNPAIQTNRCHVFLARALTLDGPQQPDEHEEIALEQVPLPEVAGLIRDGVVTHALVLSAFHLLGLREG